MFQWNQGQKEAIDRIRAWATGTKRGMMLSLSGAAGSGKTTVLSEVKNILEGKNVSWAAMTGKAALRVHELCGVKASTLHAALYARPVQGKKGRIYFNKLRNPECKFLVIDETSMMGPKIYQDLQSWIMQGVRILFVGDPIQLPPVMTPKEEKSWGKDFSVFREVEGPFLTQVMRSGDDIIDVATQLREEGQVPKTSKGGYSIRRSGRPGLDAVEEFLLDNEDHMLITWRNQLRMKANREIRRRLGFEGLLPNPEEPVIICKNGQDVLNGEIHLAGSFADGAKIGDVETHWLDTYENLELLVSTQGREEPMDGNLPEVEDWKSFHKQRESMELPDPIPITYGYVSTAHKAQGSEYKKVTIFLSAGDLKSRYFRVDTTLPNGDKMPFATRWLYTSLTRARHQVSLILGS